MKQHLASVYIFAFLGVSLLIQPCFSQVDAYVLLEGKIMDAESKKGIAYANIYNLTNGKGTISNFEGEYTFLRCQAPDSIRISYIGYETRYFLVSELSQMDLIYLKVKPELLGMVSIYGDNNFIYELLARSPKTQNNTPLQAKSYFSLESYIEDTQVELLEGYYNGIYRGYEIDDLNLKNARIALSSKGSKFFVSLETSKAQYSHRIFENNLSFPKSPFELSKSKAKRTFQVKLARSYKNEAGNTILIVDFKPKKDSLRAFEGRVWIDSTDASIQKISLQCLNAEVHPFHPIWSDDVLLKVDLNLVKTYKKVDDKMYVDAIDFNYRLSYKDRLDSLYEISTHNMIYAYDYSDAFMLPFFDFGVNEESDYRKVNATPYNTFFWKNMDEFTAYDRQKINQKFLAKASLNSETLFLGNNYFVKGFYEQPYVFWSPKRIQFDDSKIKQENDDVKSAFIRDHYKLHVQIYLDVNFLNDSLHTLTKTILDPFSSFYYFPIDAKNTAFLNLYFDFMEIQRRELDRDLKKAGNSPQKAKAIYENKMLEVERMSNIFFSNTERGNNREGMLRWNDYVVKGLNINNWEIFALDFAYD
jgi:hypothetical protein